MTEFSKKKFVQDNRKKDQKTNVRKNDQSLAKRYPLYEPGRNLVGFLKGMVSSGLTNRITDLLRGHSRKMQCEITDSIRIHIIWGEIDLTGVRHVDDELEKILDWYDKYISYL